MAEIDLQREKYREYRAKYRAKKAGRPYAEGLSSGERFCTGCSTVKPIERFPVRGSGRRHTCDICWSVKAGEQKEATRRRRNEWKRENESPVDRRKWNLKTLYGITPDDYDTLLALQGGACRICGTPDPRTESGFFPVDHDHATGQVRGLLCTMCNTALGKFMDNPDVLRSAVAYLEVDRGGGAWWLQAS